MRTLPNNFLIYSCAIFVAGSLLVLSGCGGSSTATSPNGFGMAATNQSNASETSAAVISKVELNPANVKGEGIAAITVTLAKPAPAQGLTVQLSSSDPATINIPASLNIAEGQSSASMQVQIHAAEAASLVAVIASSGSSKAGANFNVTSATTAPFTITAAPASVTIVQGKTGTSKITSKISSGYNHSLQLKISGEPVGTTTSAKPATIPAPGSGTSVVTADVQTVTETGSYPLTVTATDGTNSSSAKLTLNVTSGTTNPDATFKGCWYKSGAHRYQAVDLKVGVAGSYPFNAVLYSGTTCDANDYADQFGFGQILAVGGSYTLWFTAFADQTNLSAIWYLGDENSKCVNYSTAPPC